MIKLISLFLMIHGASADIFMMPSGLSASGDTYVLANVNQLLNNKSISYTAGSIPKWAGTPPDTIQKAIDRMAALLYQLNGNAIIP